MFKQFMKGASTIKTISMVAVLCVVFVLSLAFGASAFGFRMEGDAAPQYSDTSGGQLTSGCNIPNDYLAVLNSATQGSEASPALLAAIFYAGEHGSSWPDINGAWATSKSDAQGPFQFTEDTWKNYGEGDFSNAQDINKAAKAAANLISQNLATQHGTDAQKIQKVITRYNPNYKNTDPEYVNRVYKQYNMFLDKCYTETGNIADSADEFFLQDRQNEKEWRAAVMDQENQSGRPLIDGTMTPTAIVLHWTAGPTKQGAMSAMKSSKNAVQLIVDTDGKVYQLLPLNAKIRSGSHVASQFSIAIEIVSTTALKDGDPNQYKVHEDILMSKERTAQRDAVVNTINHLCSTYGINKLKGTSIREYSDPEDIKDPIKKMGIFGHYQTGPKKDPGESFLNEIWSRVGAE